MKLVQHFVSVHQAQITQRESGIDIEPRFYQGTKGQDVSYFEFGDKKYALHVQPAGKLILRELKPLSEEDDGRADDASDAGDSAAAK